VSKLGVLIARDFNTRIRGGAYILMTVLGVLLIVGLAFGPHIFSKIRDSFQSDAVELLVVDNTGYMYPRVAQVAEERGPAAEVRGELIDATGMPGVGDASFGKWAAQALADSGKDGILIIDEAGQDSYSPAAFTAVLYDTSNIILNDSIQNFLNTVVRRANADRLNLTLNEIALLWASAPMRLQQLTTGIAGEQASTKEVAEESKALSMVLAYFLLFVLYMALILYGNMIATGVAEEKSNRIMEIMVSTVRPIELMTGKIVGIGLLGLLQFGIWIATGLGLSVLGRSGILKNALGVPEVTLLPMDLLIWFGVFFVLGFILYATLFAAGGASVSRVEDVNQVSTMILMLVVVAFFVAYYSFINPNSSLSVVCSMIPWLSPMVMFSRIALGDPPVVEIVTSLVLLVVAIIGSMWVAARIYRVGVLMYGKRPGLKEILRYVREP